MAVQERQGLAELPYNGTDTGSLVNRQPSLIDMIISGEWRAKEQQRGTMGSVNSPTPAQDVATPGAVTAASIPTWLYIVGAVAAAFLLFGRK